MASVMGDVEHNLAVLQEILRIGKQYDPEYGKAFQEEFDNYRMAYSSVRR